MRIDQLKKDPGAFLHLERYVNGGSRTYSAFSSHIDISPKYQPTGETDYFDVPRVLVPKEKTTIFTADPQEAVYNHYIRGDQVVFAIHPEILQDDEIAYMKELRDYPRTTSIRVSPTASSRTVLTRDKHLPEHFLKMHCPRRISRFLRKYRAASVEQSVLVSRELSSINLESFAYLAKSLGVYVGTRADGWGYSIREAIPRPFKKTEGLMIPFFSLYSHDLRSPDDPPLLAQLIALHGADPMSFVLERIMFPLIEGWCHVNRETGIILAPHGQNVLLEVDTELQPQRIVHRDFIVYIDEKRRVGKGSHLNCLEHRLLKSDEERAKVYSLIYDSFIGHHLFDYLASVLERSYKVSPSELQAACKEAFSRYFPDSDQYLTDRTYYYSNEIMPDNSSKLVETHKPKVWR